MTATAARSGWRYSAVLLAGAGAVLSGVALWKPVAAAWLVTAFGGVPGARLVHLLVSTMLAPFTVVHVLQVARAGRNRARAMVVGYELHPGVDDPPTRHDRRTCGRQGRRAPPARTPRQS